MIPKPDDCKDCPWWGDGEGFVPDEVVPDAQVVFCAQNPGEVEEIQGRPLVGPTGQMFRGRFVARHLPDVRAAYANILKCRQQTAHGRTNAMPPKGSRVWQGIVDHCRPYLETTLSRCPGAILVPMGEHAALALTGLRAKAMLHLRGTLLV